MAARVGPTPGCIASQEILCKPNLTGIEAILNHTERCWSGHIACMEDKRLLKQIFYAKLSSGIWHVRGKRKTYKGVLKANLKACGIPVDEWQVMARSHTAWRGKGACDFEADCRIWIMKNWQGNPGYQIPVLSLLVNIVNIASITFVC